MELFLNDKLGKITFEVNAAGKDKPTLIVAHGAGAGMDHPFMTSLAEKLQSKGLNAVRFNFPYKEQGRKAPGSPKQAQFAWERIIEEIARIYPESPLFISGKSYGGRMASHLLAEAEAPLVKGIIYYGFPLHAPGKDSKDRAAHLKDLSVPQLFIQGTKDKLANFELISEVVTGITLAKLQKIDDADHSFNVPKRTGISKDQMPDILASHTIDWIQQVLES